MLSDLEKGSAKCLDRCKLQLMNVGLGSAAFFIAIGLVFYVTN
jgi:hypothetical protein